MKLSDGWILTELADEYVAVPVGENAESFHGVVHLNATGRDIWEGLQAGLCPAEIAAKLVETYDGVTRERALASVTGVMDTLRAEGLITD